MSSSEERPQAHRDPEARASRAVRDTIALSESEAERQLEEVQRALGEEGLPALVLSELGGGGEFEFREILGEGGMGLVAAAWQRSLDREVALKFLREDARTDATTAALLHEAQLTGQLEHPNIIPIHTIGATEHGPAVVMKRISGKTWFDLIEESPPLEDLPRHIDILLRVCDAVRYAHSRGVVHRDIKPDNVMLGDYGEVYLADWGVAFKPGAKRKRSSIQVAGTPAYMSPELADGRIEDIGPASDIYLLGATLIELIYGEPPHLADTVAEALEFARRPLALPDAPPVAAELAEIAMRACQTKPADRYQSVDELQEALRAYRQHRVSAEMSELAWRSLEAALASPDVDASGDQRVLMDELVMRFRQAQEIWPDNERATQGLYEARVFALEFDVQRGNLGAARSMAKVLGEATPAPLLEAIERLREERHRQRLAERELDQIRRRKEIRAGSKFWKRAGMSVALICAIFLARSFISRPSLEFPPREVTTAVAISVAFIWLILLWVGRSRLSETDFGRRAATACTTSAVGIALVRVASLLGDASAIEAAQRDLIVIAASCVPMALSHAVFFAPTIFALGGMYLIELFPHYARVTFNAAIYLSVLTTYLTWGALDRHRVRKARKLARTDPTLPTLPAADRSQRQRDV